MDLKTEPSKFVLGGGNLDSGNGAQVAAGKNSDGGGGWGLGEEKSREKGKRRNEES